MTARDISGSLQVCDGASNRLIRYDRRVGRRQGATVLLSDAVVR